MIAIAQGNYRWEIRRKVQIRILGPTVVEFRHLVQKPSLGRLAFELERPDDFSREFGQMDWIMDLAELMDLAEHNRSFD